jgi:hypothetical protein
MFHDSNPVSLNRYRADTARQSAMPGVTMPSFRCSCCKQTKAVAGRKQIIKGAPKYGYVCGDCQ